MIDILESAIALLEENNHCKGTYSQDSDGLCCKLNSPNAASFCTIGALGRGVVLRNGTLDGWYNYIDRVIDVIDKVNGIENLVTWNDSVADKDAVLAVLRKTLEHVRAEASNQA